MNKRPIIILSLATLIIYAWPMWQWMTTIDKKTPRFAIEPETAAVDKAPPYMSEEFISPDLKEGMVHGASICQLSDGRLAAVWYGGSREGASDTAIFLSMRTPGRPPSWSRPRVIVNRESASDELQRFVKKVGNSIIFADYENSLWLIYVTVTVGGWSGSSLNVKISYDAGATWTKSKRLTLSPFLNISELVRNRPVPLIDGGFSIPIYHECLGKFPELLWIQKGRAGQGLVFDKSRMAGGRSFIQPAVVAYGPKSAAAFYRNCSDQKRVGMAVTGDTGGTWSSPRDLELPNPDSALDALLLSDGSILMAFNDSKYYRKNLRLAISQDRGINWRRIARLEDMDRKEFSYPYLIRGRKGRIHLVYTWQRKRIKYRVFNEAWVEAHMKKAQE